MQLAEPLLTVIVGYNVMTELGWTSAIIRSVADDSKPLNQKKKKLKSTQLLKETFSAKVTTKSIKYDSKAFTIVYLTETVRNGLSITLVVPGSKESFDLNPICSHYDLVYNALKGL